MGRNLPPLNALRAFEAAGRHLSFTKAAEELHVTPAAISHQVKHLEDWLGVRLFRRITRGLLLTDAGQIILPPIGRSLDGLAGAIREIDSLKDSSVLTLSVMPSLAAKKLLPALPRFQSRHPEIDLHLLATTRSVDLARDGIDIAIRYGHGNWPDLRVDLLRTEELLPVCSPALLEGPHPLKTPDDLRYHTLLHDLFWKDNFVGEFPDWSTWLEEVGIDDIGSDHGLALTPSDMVFQAAIAGQGVALGRSVLVEDDLAHGRLVQPFGPAIPLDWSYYLVSPRTTEDSPKVVALRKWIMEEIGDQSETEKTTGA